MDHSTTSGPGDNAKSTTSTKATVRRTAASRSIRRPRQHLTSWEEMLRGCGVPLQAGNPEGCDGDAAAGSITSQQWPWAEHADKLAAWTDEHLVNRTDVWGAYLPADRREAGKSNNYTAPPQERRFDGALTLGLLHQHYVGEDVGHLIGLHAVGRDNKSRWLVVDIDKHGDDDPATPETNFSAACGWWASLRERGFSPLLLDSNGKGGFHLLQVFAAPVVAACVHAFGRALVQDFAERGLAQAPETFPKQAAVTPQRPYGNWWRLPGRHHTRDHWTRVWDGCRWLDGVDAIRRILVTQGDAPDLIPAEPPSVASPQTSRDTVNPGSSTADGTPAAKTCDHWLDLLRGRTAGGRHDAAVQLAGHLLRHRLDPEVVAELCVIWNAARNQPPRPEDHIRETVRDIAQREADRRAEHESRKLINRRSRTIRKEVPE